MEKEIKVTHNLFELKRRLEIHKRRRYTWTDISSATGIHRNTLNNYASNKSRGVDLDVVGKLLDFFASEGLLVTVADLFTVTEETE
jgi:hypothetical protein